MTKKKKIETASKEKAGKNETTFCCGDLNKMTQMMKKFCKDETGKFDCGTMMQQMQKMCGSKFDCCAKS